MSFDLTHKSLKTPQISIAEHHTIGSIDNTVCPTCLKGQVIEYIQKNCKARNVTSYYLYYSFKLACDFFFLNFFFVNHE